MARSTVPADALAAYERLVGTIAGLERKGAAMPYTSRGGHMFSFLTPQGVLALRLPDDAREVFLKKYKTKLCVQHGVVMREYVEVPKPILKKTGELAAYLRQSYDYVGSLEPKATTRKKPAGKKRSR